MDEIRTTIGDGFSYSTIYAETYDSFEFTATADSPRGIIILVGDVYGFPYIDVLTDNQGELVYACKRCKIKKATGVSTAFEVGGSAWLDTTLLTVHPTFSEGDVCVGFCVQAATDDDTDVMLDFDGGVK